jgi:hypothetical protein
MQGVALRVLGLRWSQLLRAAAPGVAAGIATGGAALLVVLFLPGPDVLVLAVAVLAGVLAGAGTLHATAPSLSRDMLQLLRRP